jgi:hypothetical protein
MIAIIIAVFSIFPIWLATEIYLKKARFKKDFRSLFIDSNWKVTDFMPRGRAVYIPTNEEFYTFFGDFGGELLIYVPESLSFLSMMERDIIKNYIIKLTTKDKSTNKILYSARSIAVEKYKRESVQ